MQCNTTFKVQFDSEFPVKNNRLTKWLSGRFVCYQKENEISKSNNFRELKNYTFYSIKH